MLRRTRSALSCEGTVFHSSFAAQRATSPSQHSFQGFANPSQFPTELLFSTFEFANYSWAPCGMTRLFQECVDAQGSTCPMGNSMCKMNCRYLLEIIEADFGAPLTISLT